jgi:hypothetical protein
MLSAGLQIWLLEEKERALDLPALQWTVRKTIPPLPLAVCPSVSNTMPLDTLWHDLRHGLRAWRLQPSFYAIALEAALALGIGANTTIFSVIQTVLIRPFPYQDAARLVNIFEKEPKNGVQRYFVPPSDYYDWRDRSSTLEAFGLLPKQARALA